MLSALRRRLLLLSLIGFGAALFCSPANATTWTSPPPATTPVTISVTGYSGPDPGDLCLGLKLDTDANLDSAAPWSIPTQRCFAGNGSTSGSCTVSITSGNIARLYAWTGPYGNGDCSDVSSWDPVEGTTIFTEDPPLTITIGTTAATTTEIDPVADALYGLGWSLGLLVFLLFGTLGFFVGRKTPR